MFVKEQDMSATFPFTFRSLTGPWFWWMGAKLCETTSSIILSPNLLKTKCRKLRTSALVNWWSSWTSWCPEYWPGFSQDQRKTREVLLILFPMSFPLKITSWMGMEQFWVEKLEEQKVLRRPIPLSMSALLSWFQPPGHFSFLREIHWDEEVKLNLPSHVILSKTHLSLCQWFPKFSTLRPTMRWCC